MHIIPPIFCSIVSRSFKILMRETENYKISQKSLIKKGVQLHCLTFRISVLHNNIFFFAETFLHNIIFIAIDRKYG